MPHGFPRTAPSKEFWIKLDETAGMLQDAAQVFIGGLRNEYLTVLSNDISASRHEKTLLHSMPIERLLRACEAIEALNIISNARTIPENSVDKEMLANAIIDVIKLSKKGHINDIGRGNNTSLEQLVCDHKDTLLGMANEVVATMSPKRRFLYREIIKALGAPDKGNEMGPML